MLTRTCAPQRPVGVAASRALRPVRPVPASRLPVLRAATTDAKKDKKEAVEDEFVHDGPEFAPSTQQVASLLNTLCNETEIAEMHLKMAGFELKVRRSVAGSAGAVPVHVAPVAHAAPVADAALAMQSMEGAAPSMEDTVDESLVYVTSPKVGIFRRGKYAGGKRVGKGNLMDVGAKVKRGQALGYVEQLGTFVEVKAPIAGELVKVHIEDGSPVEYQQLIAEVAPFFGGHIIGDSKYA